MQVLDIVISCDIWLMKPTKHATQKIATRFNSKPHDTYEIYKLWINFELYSTKFLTNQVKQLSMLEHKPKKLWCKNLKKLRNFWILEKPNKYGSFYIYKIAMEIY
jgi:hypothetical protein